MGSKRTCVLILDVVIDPRKVFPTCKLVRPSSAMPSRGLFAGNINLEIHCTVSRPGVFVLGPRVDRVAWNSSCVTSADGRWEMISCAVWSAAVFALTNAFRRHPFNLRHLDSLMTFFTSMTQSRVWEASKTLIIIPPYSGSSREIIKSLALCISCWTDLGTHMPTPIGWLIGL